MPNGYGRGYGRAYGRGGWGFGFRGSSPPWPYVGLGRGGLPRCGYFLSGAAAMPAQPDYPFYDNPEAAPYYGETGYAGAIPYGYAGAPMEAMPGADPYAPQMNRQQELDFLKSQAEALGSELDVIMRRLEELGK
jgi:hypothetical protein